MKIIVFGASGRLGSKIIEYANLNKVKCISVGNKKKCDLNLDLTKTDVSKILKKQKPSIIFNCVALTNVDSCNKNFSKAYKMNVITIENLSKAIVKSNIKTKLIHISTDQVYNNVLIRKKNNEKNINLSNGYSITKFMGELEALKYNNALVIRTNFFGNVFSQNIQTYTDYITNNLIKKKKK